MKLSDQPSSRRPTPDSIKEYLAKTSTSYSDMPVSLRLEIRKPVEAIAAIYLSLFFQPWQTDVLIRSVAHRAYANCYQGRWELVQKILELELSQPSELEAWYIEYNPYEFFGNILPLADRIEKRCRYIDLRLPNKKPVRRKVRHRGYDDKGSCRFPHEDHGERPTNEAREDRRSFVKLNPLCRVVREAHELYPDRGDAAGSIPTKGGEENVHVSTENQN